MGRSMEFDIDAPTVESVRATPRDHGKRRFVLVTMPGSDPFDLIAPMTVLREANFYLAWSGRPDLVYDFEVVSNQPGTVFEAEGLRIVVDKPCYDIRGDVDTVVFQAVDYEGKCLRDERFIAWIRRISKGAARNHPALSEHH